MRLQQALEMHGIGVVSDLSTTLSQGFPSLREGGHFPSHTAEK